MAIVPGLPGVEIFMKMNGAKLAEFDNNEDEAEDSKFNEYQNSRPVTKYIESQTDQ